MKSVRISKDIMRCSSRWSARKI